jgi:hypothetical protein
LTLPGILTAKVIRRLNVIRSSLLPGGKKEKLTSLNNTEKVTYLQIETRNVSRSATQLFSLLFILLKK